MAAIQVSRWNELSMLYARASALDAAERGIWLIELALQRHPLLPALQRLLDAPPGRPIDEAFTRPGRGAALYRFDRLPRRSAPARCLGRYRLLQSLSNNSAAEIWLACRAEERGSPAMLPPPDDAVIVKRLAPHHGGAAPAERFLQQAAATRQALAPLRALGVATLADAGIGADGHPWLAVAPVDGEPITLHADHARLPLAVRLHLLRRVLIAVTKAHAAGIAHGDLRPASVLLTADGGLRICAFGITALERGWAGHGALPSAADDTRALGALLYELLCGRAPLPAPGRSVDGVVTSLGPVMPSRQYADAAVAAARGTTPGVLQHALAGPVDALAMRAVDASPAGFANVDELLGAVDECIAAMPTTAAAVAAPEAPWPLWHRALAVTAATLAATALAWLLY